MIIVSIANQKGGTAKTTTTVAFASILGSIGYRVLVVEIDPQGSIHWLLTHRQAQLAANGDGTDDELPFWVVYDVDPDNLARLRELDGQYDIVFVDTPGSMSQGAALKAVFAASDYIVLPCVPAAYDMVALAATITSYVKPSGRPYKVLATRVDSRAPADLADARAALNAWGAPQFDSHVRELKAHQRGPRDARLIFDVDSPGALKAYQDYHAVAVELLADAQSAGLLRVSRTIKQRLEQIRDPRPQPGGAASATSKPSKLRTSELTDSEVRS